MRERGGSGGGDARQRRQLASSQTGVVILKSFQRGRRTGGCVSRTELEGSSAPGRWGLSEGRGIQDGRGGMGSKLFQGEGAGSSVSGWGTDGETARRAPVVQLSGR